MHLVEWKVFVLIQILLKSVPEGPVDNMPALFQVMVWHQTGDKPVPNPVMIHFIDAYMSCQISVG